MTSNNKATTFVYALFGFGEKQNKKQYAIIVMIHIVAWVVFFSLPLLFFNIQVSNNRFFLKETINKLLLVAFFYFNYYYLIPVFFSRQKRKRYILLLLASFLFLLAQEIYTERYFFNNVQAPFTQTGWHRQSNFHSKNYKPNEADPARPPWPGMDPENQKTIFGIPKMFFFRSLMGLLSSVFIMVLLGGFIRLAFSFFKSQGEKKVLRMQILLQKTIF